MKKTAILVLLSAGLATSGITCVSVANADDAGVVLDAGVGSGSAALPADVLHDPVTHPQAAFDDARAAQKIGWPLCVLAVLIMLARGAQTAGKKWAWRWLAWLNTGVRAFVLAGIGTVGAAAFNSLALGGTWFAVALAAAASLLALMAPTPKPASTPA